CRIAGIAGRMPGVPPTEDMLRTAIDHMAMGVLLCAPDRRVRFYNHRLPGMLDLPRTLLDGAPALSELKELQAGRGDFGENFERVDERGRAYVESGSRLAPPGTYWRKAPDGRMLEVHCTALPDGGLLHTFA
ncbi:PAS-domain containing protein, partial [Streptococcus suis]|uniref:PAS-domain containing protein n=1 Tax=Streptococcus suis TaxID=1307 RepID=UPI00211CFD14